MRKVLTLTLLVVAASFAKAQQQAQYSQYMVNPFLINPSLSSAQDYVDIMTGYRSQWTGFDGAPETVYLSGHMPLNKPHVIMTHPGDYHNWYGIGGLIMQDKTGPISQTSFYGNFSYNLKITEGHGFGLQHQDGIRLAFGMFLGGKQFSVNPNEIDLTGEGPGSGSFSDAAINAAAQSKFVADASLGAYLYFGERFYVGFSSFQLFGNKIKYNETEESRLARHYFYNIGAKFQLQRDWYFMPSILVKNVFPATPSVDLNARVDYKDTFYGGLSYRHGDALVAMLGTIIDLAPNNKKHYKLNIGYSYDITTSDIRTVSNGSHEVILGIQLPPMYVDRNAEDTWKFWKYK